MPDPDKIQSLLQLCAIALADERIAPEEIVLLHKMALEKGVSPAQLDAILLAPAGTAELKPVSFDARLALMHDAVQVMVADGHTDERELAAIHRCAAALQFTGEQAEKIITMLLTETAKGTAPDEMLTRLRIHLLP